MTKNIWITIIFVFVLVFIFPFVSLVLVRLIPGNDQPGFSGHVTKVVYGNIIASQTFNSSKNNLSGVGLSIKNPSNANNKSVVLKIYNSEGVLIRTSEINGYSIQDGSFVKFVFETIPDSLNQDYKFEISSPQATDKDSVGAFWDENVGIPAVYFFKPDSKIKIIIEVVTNLFSRLQLLGSQTFL